MMDDKYMPIPPDSPFGQMLEKFKGFDFSNLASAHSGYDYEAINRQMHENIRSIEVDSIIPDGYFEKTQEYQQKSLEVLQSINENTANLYTMVELISRSNDKQDELISLITEVFSLAKAKNKEEADTMFKKIMGKINDTADSVDSIIKIVGWATTVYSMVLPLLP